MVFNSPIFETAMGVVGALGLHLQAQFTTHG